MAKSKLKKLPAAKVKKAKEALARLSFKPDPLHVPYEKLIVKFRGQEVYYMNKALLDRQNCWENLDAIKEAHYRKLTVYELIEKAEDPVVLKHLGKTLTEIEFELQGLWKFTLDYNFHRIWEYPKCTCPQLDNRERYPHGHSISANCPLHGFEVPELTRWEKFKQKLSNFWESTKKAMSEIDTDPWP